MIINNRWWVIGLLIVVICFILFAISNAESMDNIFSNSSDDDFVAQDFSRFRHVTMRDVGQVITKLGQSTHFEKEFSVHNWVLANRALGINDYKELVSISRTSWFHVRGLRNRYMQEFDRSLEVTNNSCRLMNLINMKGFFKVPIHEKEWLHIKDIISSNCTSTCVDDLKIYYSNRFEDRIDKTLWLSNISVKNYQNRIQAFQSVDIFNIEELNEISPKHDLMQYQPDIESIKLNYSNMDPCAHVVYIHLKNFYGIGLTSHEKDFLKIFVLLGEGYNHPKEHNCLSELHELLEHGHDHSHAFMH